MVSQAMALTSSDFSVDRSSTSRPTGVIIAPPMPCRKRAATNSMRSPTWRRRSILIDENADRNGKDAPRAEPVGHPAGDRNEDRQRHQIGRQASLSEIGLVPISVAIAGSAVAMTVESICSMKRATARTSGIERFKGDIRWSRDSRAGQARR
jgi:hypothetical protein